MLAGMRGISSRFIAGSFGGADELSVESVPSVKSVPIAVLRAVIRGYECSEF
jgi:hypothetical protein